MKTLTLIRHAKSSWSDSGLTDKQRPLNARGLRDAPEMGARLNTHGIRPSLICASPAVRAWTTAKLIADAIGYPQEFLQREDGLYLASTDSIRDVLLGQDSGFNSIALVGHNPGMTQFANQLIPGLTNNLSTAGIVSVQFEQDDWNLYETPTATLLVHDWPKRHD